jgi:3-phosphoinositide dependent protein kinase-1
VDFGTAKDLFQPDLNGPDFVGTAEYMAPSTVNNRPGGVEVDLWALGAVLCQMILGYTPFGSASPYLVFLRIKRAFLRVGGHQMTSYL